MRLEPIELFGGLGFSGAETLRRDAVDCSSPAAVLMDALQLLPRMLTAEVLGLFCGRSMLCS